MTKQKAKKKGNYRNGNGFSAKEMEMLRRARREGKVISFAGGFPQVMEPQNEVSQSKNCKKEKVNHPVHIGDVLLELPVWSILGPITDLISMVSSLEMYASHYSEALSVAERRREDCTHALNPKNARQDDNAALLSDTEILAIGKKLQRIGAERRTIKNRFEILKMIKKCFESPEGAAALAFLESMATDVLCLQEEQKVRHYTPRTNELEDLDTSFGSQHRMLQVANVRIGGGDADG